MTHKEMLATATNFTGCAAAAAQVLSHLGPEVVFRSSVRGGAEYILATEERLLWHVTGAAGTGQLSDLSQQQRVFLREHAGRMKFVITNGAFTRSPGPSDKEWILDRLGKSFPLGYECTLLLRARPSASAELARLIDSKQITTVGSLVWCLPDRVVPAFRQSWRVAADAVAQGPGNVFKDKPAELPERRPGKRVFRRKLEPPDHKIGH